MSHREYLKRHHNNVLTFVGEQGESWRLVAHLCSIAVDALSLIASVLCGCGWPSLVCEAELGTFRVLVVTFCVCWCFVCLFFGGMSATLSALMGAVGFLPLNPVNAPLFSRPLTLMVTGAWLWSDITEEEKARIVNDYRRSIQVQLK